MEESWSLLNLLTFGTSLSRVLHQLPGVPAMEYDEQPYDTVYTAILTADYDEQQETVNVQIRHEDTLPRQPPANRTFGLYPVKGPAARLDTGDQDIEFLIYDIHNRSVDNAFQEVLEESDTDPIHWGTWLEDEGYEEFVHSLREAAEQEDAVYLLASDDELQRATIHEETKSYLEELRKMREQAPWYYRLGFPV